MGADAELRIERRPELEQPGAHLLLPRLERRRPGRLARQLVPRPHLAGRAVRRDRPRALLRLPGDAAARLARRAAERRIDWPENSFQHARVRARRRRAARRRCCCSARSRACAGGRSRGLVTGLATELGVSMVVTLGSLLADVPHTRPAPVTASATEPDAARAARPSAVALRGPDRRRRRAPRRLPRRPASRRSRSGRRCRTTSR